MKARRATKDDVVQARIPHNDKMILQSYADRRGMTLSDLLRRTVRHLAVQVQNERAIPGEDSGQH